MRSLLMLMLLSLSACGQPGAEPLDPDIDPIEAGEWSRPAAATTWQWQLLGAVNTTYEVDAYDVDLFDAPDATLDAIAGQDRLVICYFSAGSIEDWRDDAAQFPESAIGRRLDGWEGERWLDVRHPQVLGVMEARLDLAAERGCDLVEPDNVDSWDNPTGFDLERDDTLAYLKLLSNAAHARGLGIAKKNGADTVDELVTWFDAAVVEECGAYQECDVWDPFIAADKAVWQAEYPSGDDLAGAESLAEEVCPAAIEAGRQALILPLDLDDAFRVACEG